MQSVVASIEDMGCEVVHIPPGCTCVGQPVDVGYNKPLKGHIRDSFEAWLMAEVIMHKKVKYPTREHVIGWIKEAVSNVGVQSVRNAWRYKNFAYFVPTVAPRPMGYATPQAIMGEASREVSGYSNEDDEENMEENLDDERVHRRFI